MKKLMKALLKLTAILGGAYAGLFLVFFFDLDGKAIYKFVEPFMAKRFDSMERKDPLQMVYETKTPNYEYKV